MKKLGVFLVFLVLSGILAGEVLADNDYKEVQENSYQVHWDGSAEVTFRTILYGPEDMLNKTKETIIQMGLENATKLFVNQKVQSLKNLGLNLENATGKIIGYNTTDPLETVITGRITNLAKYYSYDGVWEITLDALRISDLANINPTVINSSIYLENYFTVTLPSGAKVTNITKGFDVESNGSYIKLETKEDGGKVTVHSIIYLKNGVSRDDLKTLYAKLQPVIITYTGQSGNEVYSTWKMTTETNITIRSNETIVDTLEKYEEPESYVNSLKMQFLIGGVQTAEQSIYQNRLEQFQTNGIKVINGNVKLLNLNSTEPLMVKYHWILQGLIGTANGNYIYTYDPRLELGNLTFPYRLTVAINETKTTRIILPEGYKFTSIPQNISVETKAGSVKMTINKVSDREVVISSNVYLTYGAPSKDYRDLMAQIPENVEFKYEKTGGSGICGPAGLLLIGLVPLIIRRRK
ncbi:hypothetical protein [Thermococcus gorgonarius]|uniref:Uncharacterized protein n=1 Tax=Thermococcus gorgonarius TaxID=71997 RepID=A0A2Z2M6Q0_THEGO|nr:hypothetical protein [Thermococcus gorgonarius]ASJ00909.1 hypothetical protein A3K92_05145 [Thermococcus gorgonarius]